MQQPKDKRYTYEDYLTWDGDVRYELIDGVPYMMAPAPGTGHQRISRKVLVQLDAYLRGKTCEVFHAPFDVRLADDTVVQPDISVICDPNKLDDRGCKGAPDMVVEILSPSTQRMDSIKKLGVYRDAGVREYWIVSQENRSVSVYLLRDGEYVIRVYEAPEAVPVGVLEDCAIDLGAVFPAQEEA